MDFIKKNTLMTGSVALMDFIIIILYSVTKIIFIKSNIGGLTLEIFVGIICKCAKCHLNGGGGGDSQTIG